MRWRRPIPTVNDLLSKALMTAVIEGDKWWEALCGLFLLYKSIVYLDKCLWPFITALVCNCVVLFFLRSCKWVNQLKEQRFARRFQGPRWLINCKIYFWLYVYVCFLLLTSFRSSCIHYSACFDESHSNFTNTICFANILPHDLSYHHASFWLA